MNYFIGNYDYSVDAKGRVNVPAKFRKMLSPEAEETFVIVRGADTCLRAYPKDAWDRYFAKVSALPRTPRNVKYLRVLSSTSTFSTLDVQGRIMLTSSLMEFAGITKEVVIIGMSDYLELWSPAEFKAYSGSEQDFDAIQYEIEEEIADIEKETAEFGL